MGRQIIRLVSMCSLLVLFATESAADWKLYVSGGLGISGSIVDTDGSVPGTPIIPLTGDDGDSSPLVDGAFGLEIPMNELVPREYLVDMRLPSWSTRFELEAAGLREYEIETAAGATNFYSTLNVTTVMVNTWLDIPLTAIYRPVQYTFGLGRQPRIRQWLEPGSFFLGAGIGFSALELEGSSNVLSGDDTIIDFAWNVGAGVNYALTDTVDLSAGYRFVGIGAQEIDITNGGVPVAGAGVEYDSQIHELRVQIRVEVFEFLNPWR